MLSIIHLKSFHFFAVSTQQFIPEKPALPLQLTGTQNTAVAMKGGTDSSTIQQVLDTAYALASSVADTSHEVKLKSWPHWGPNIR